MLIHPIDDYIFVLREDSEKTTKGGIVIPRSDPNKQMNPPAIRGEVIAVGPGFLTHNGDRVKMTVKTGDIVAYNGHYPTNSILIDSVTYHIIKERDVFAVLDRSDEIEGEEIPQ